MIKTYLKCILEDEYVRKVKKYKIKNNFYYKEYFELAFEDFVKTLKKNRPLILKENYFEKLKTSSISFPTSNDIDNQLNELSKKHNLSKKFLVREILIQYIKKQKDL